MGHNLEHTFGPADFLVEHFTLLPPGRVLDVAMGNGCNAVFLAARGFEVEGVDRSAEAVATALKMAAEKGVRITATVADLEAGYVIPDEAYDGIVCFNYLQRSLIPSIKTGLRRGGVVIYETFITDQARFGKPRNPDYLLQHNELLRFFHDFRCLRYREGVFENGLAAKKAIASIVAEKV
ncbi:MAG: methyltransferase domain-containing protein [Chloroflexi bacterium]|nr:methyltransferase domain-containing protein [Chloroflexota bacterium]